MIHEIVAVGPLACNCHILADEKTREAVVVDPGDDAEAILEKVRDFTVVGLLHTHCHFDHMTATRRVSEATGAGIFIHRSDKALYDDLAGQYEYFEKVFGARLGRGHDPLPVTRFLEHGERLTFGSQALRVIHTPGHTQGSCCFHTEGHLFSGDTLFNRGVGRWDLPGGNLESELDSIRTRLYPLDPETLVWPGHGPETAIGEERDANPFTR